MRTTVDIDDDLVVAAKDLARSENRTLGEVLSDLIRRGLRLRVGEEGDFPTFRVSERAPAITSAMVMAALDEPD